MKQLLKSCLLVMLIAVGAMVSVADAVVIPCTYLPNVDPPIDPPKPQELTCAAKFKSCSLACYEEMFKDEGFLILPCLVKCRMAFSDPTTLKGCIDKRESKLSVPLLVSAGPVMRAKVDAHVTDLGTTVRRDPPSKCVRAQLKCFANYDACVLKLFAKVLKQGNVCPNYGACDKYIIGDKNCIAKARAKYVLQPLNPCIDPDVVNEMKLMDDAFVNDMVYAIAAGPSDMNTQRCTGNTAVKCSNAPGGTGGPCTGLGTCEFYFGAPLPMAAGGVATCVTNRWVGGISGTFNQQTGDSAGAANLVATVFSGIDIATPCPRCVGDPFPNDGVSAGLCSGGSRDGLACDGNGESPEPAFGVTSLDCPPLGQIGVLPIDLGNSTGTVTRTVTAASPSCNGAPGKKCLCATCSEDSSKPCGSDSDCTGTCSNSAGEPRRPSSCVDDTATIGVDESLCAPTVDGKGSCPNSPVTQHCKIQTFRTCIGDADCDVFVAGDECGTYGRQCFPSFDGNVGDAISATGLATASIDHTSHEIFASVFCLAPTSSPSVNAAAGLPGPGRLQLGGVGADDGTATTCPTVASFLPTSKRGVLDVGWTGIAHSARVIGQAKVSVGVTGCTLPTPDGSGNCGVCTYAGPISNPDAAP